MITVKSRIKLRRDTTANWNQNINFIPLEGEAIIYTDYRTIDNGDGTTTTLPGIKIGDGNAYLIDLPFVTDGVAGDLLRHEQNTNIHVTSADKEYWNSKFGGYVYDENLIFENS